MAEVEHKDITDPSIHETKGMLAALDGQVHVKLAGAGAWADPLTLINSRQTTVFTGATNTNQVPGALDTPLGVTFGGPVVGTDISHSAGGILTINTDGFYSFKINLSIGRTSSAGSAIIIGRMLINGTPTGFVQGAKLPDATSSTVTQFDVGFAAVAGTTVAIEIMQDSAGIANGGLIGINPTLAGWGDVPSACCLVTKFIGTDD